MINNMYGNIDLLSKALNATWKRNEVLANNIANANTPNFKKSDVEFEGLLQNYLRGKNVSGTVTHDKHINIGVKNINELHHRVITKRNHSIRQDQNNVDIDVEMAKLAQNSIAYNTLTTQLNNHMQRMKLAINEGRK